MIIDVLKETAPFLISIEVDASASLERSLRITEAGSGRTWSYPNPDWVEYSLKDSMQFAFEPNRYAGIRRSVYGALPTPEDHRLVDC